MFADYTVIFCRMKKLITLFYILSLRGLLPINVLAQSYDIVPTENIYPNIIGGLIGVALVFFIYGCFVLFWIIYTVIWVLSLIDIIGRDNWKRDNDKLIWVLLIVFIPLIGVYYYFFHRKNLDKDILTS